ncbi:MAG: hypothetical protein HY459_01205 [Parcubacteria group bacterium]|nr:hypothetical protein [Parcubacteria group bacterium]
MRVLVFSLALVALAVGVAAEALAPLTITETGLGPVREITLANLDDWNRVVVGGSGNFTFPEGSSQTFGVAQRELNADEAGFDTVEATVRDNSVTFTIELVAPALNFATLQSGKEGYINVAFAVHHEGSTATLIVLPEGWGVDESLGSSGIGAFLPRR